MKEAVDEANYRLRLYQKIFDLNPRLATYGVTFSNRLTSSSGRCLFHGRRIVLSGLFFKKYGWAEMDQTLRHEMVHAHLFEEGLPPRHSASPFRQYAARIGARLWHTMSLEPNYVYRCPACGRLVHRVRPLSPDTACGAHGAWSPEYILQLKRRREPVEGPDVTGGSPRWAGR